MQLLMKDNADCLDQWVLYLRLMDVWFELNAPIEKLYDFIVVMQDRSRRLEKPVRSPFLALLELCKQLRQRNLSFPPELKLIDAFLIYFNQFGMKPSCFGDLLYYFRAFFDGDSAAELTEEFLAALNAKFAETKKVQQMDVNIRTIQAFFAMQKPDFDAKSLVISLLKAYADQIPLKNKGENGVAEDQPNTSPPTSVDGYLWLAVQFLWPKVDSHPQQVLQVIRILEAGLQKSPENYLFRISLGKLYFLLGAASTGIDVIDRLDVKYCQRESMAYLLYDQMSVWGTPKGVTMWCQGLQQFFRISDREANEMLLQAYKNGSFVQAIEFTRFREQLTDTLHRTATLIEFPYYACLLDVAEFDHLGEVNFSFSLQNPNLI